MAYFWGESMGPEALGQAMLALHCVRGMHLDMNTKHTGCEFYARSRPGKRAARSRPQVEPRQGVGAVLEQALGFRSAVGSRSRR